MNDRRSLPPRYIDLIRDGVPGWQMKRDGRDKAVYNGMYRTALAAVNAGWDFTEWAYQLTRRGSVLGAQAATKRNGEDRPQQQAEKQLRIVWDRAAAQAEGSPSFGVEDRRAYVADVRTWLSDPGCPAAENVRLLVDAVARRCADLGVTSTACSRDYLMAETGLGLTALRTAQRLAEESGLLFIVQKGRRWRSGQAPASGIATVYRLPRPEVLPALGSSDTHTSAAIAASSAPRRCPPKASSAPPPTTKPQVNRPVLPQSPTTQEDPVTPDALTARMDAMQATINAQNEAITLLRMEVERHRVPDAALAPVRHLRPVHEGGQVP